MLILDVPSDRTDLKQRAVVDAVLREALAGHTGVVTPIIGRDTFRVVHSLSGAVERRLEQARVASGFEGDAGAFASALLVRALENPREGKVDSGSGDPERDRLQAGMREVAWEAQQARKVAMIEGGTGVGKSRVMGHVATEMVAAGKRVAVCAPTVANLYHLAAEIREVNAKVRIGLLLGRGQLVHVTLLREWLAERGKEAPKEVKQWVKRGGACVTEATKRLNKEVCDGDLAWLMDDLKAIAPEGFDAAYFSQEDFRRRGTGEEEDAEEEDEGDQVYQALNRKAEVSGIVLATGARVFSHVLGRTQAGFGERGWDYLIVDEAHQLASVAAGMLTNSLCLSSAERTVGPAEVWRPYRLGKAAERARNALVGLRGGLGGVPEGMMPLPVLRGLGGEIAEARKALGELTAKMRKKNYGDTWRLWRLRKYSDALVVLDRITSGEVNDLAFLQRSPVRGFPSIEVGPRSIYGPMRRLWEMSAGAALFSGTLYLRLRTGEYSARHIAGTELCIPPERLLEAKPFVQSWLTADPVLITPIKDRGKFNYRSEEAFVKRWHGHVARVIEKARKSAKGGVLVLVPSFGDVEGIREAVKVPKAVLCWQDREMGVREARERFLALSAKGKRPVWIATGGAWASLDLSDQSVKASEDTLLTDLIIPRIPFGLSRGSTYEVRRAKIGFGADVNDAYFLLRQGFGRLMRRKGLRHRRVWFLDTRPEKRKGYAIFSKFLETYEQREHLDCSVL